MQILVISILLVHIAQANHIPDQLPVPADYGNYPADPIPFQYVYAVNDDYAGLHYGQEKSSDGYATSGQYHVLLPDGRTQTVKYTVDGQNGYVAEVSYR